MTTIKIEDKKYISGDYVLENTPIYSKGARGPRDLIKKKVIDKSKYIFARNISDKWIVNDGKSVKFDKVFFDKAFIKTIPELNNSTTITDEKGIEKAPNIIYLSDEQKFKDHDGNIIEIETRGECHVDRIYFRIKDVAKEFGMENLQDNIIKEHTSYTKDINYKYFNCERKKSNTKTVIKKELFVTFEGLMRILFNARDTRTKENNIVNNIKKYINYNWLCNKQLKCLYRPDMYTIINNNILMIEIDENQHNNYDSKLEIERIQKIYKELDKKNMTIIRINPDIYIDSENNKHESIVNNINEFNIRMNIIINIIKQNIETKQNGLTTIYLFYNKYKLTENIDTNKYNFIYNINKNYDRLRKIILKLTHTNFIYYNKNNQQKNKIAADILGVSPLDVEEVFNADTNTLPCVYLMTLNTVKNLRQSMNIDTKYNDDSIVCKYGFTKDLSRRTGEHIDTFKKIENTELKLKYYAYMDPQFMSKGESDIRLFMNALNINFNYGTMEELVIIPKELMSLVHKQYEMISKNYMGHISELITKIKELEDKYEKQLLNHKYEIQQSKYEMQQITHTNTLLENKLEMQREKYEHEMLKKEVEIMKMQMKK